MKKLKKLPKFNNEKEEREFWDSNDSADYLDWSKADFSIFPNLKSSTKTISIRMPEQLLDSIKVLANKADVPYQSYMKFMLSEKVKERLSI
jgi:predicted DNA binding CopG/RHH family protein